MIWDKKTINNIWWKLLIYCKPNREKSSLKLEGWNLASYCNIHQFFTIMLHFIWLSMNGNCLLVDKINRKQERQLVMYNTVITIMCGYAHREYCSSSFLPFFWGSMFCKTVLSLICLNVGGPIHERIMGNITNPFRKPSTPMMVNIPK